jgi:hypothetical protein
MISLTAMGRRLRRLRYDQLASVQQLQALLDDDRAKVTSCMIRSQPLAQFGQGQRRMIAITQQPGIQGMNQR